MLEGFIYRCKGDYPENYFNQNRIEICEKLVVNVNGRTWEAPLAPFMHQLRVCGCDVFCHTAWVISSLTSASIACFNSSSARGLQSVQVWKGVFGLRVKWFLDQRGKKTGDGLYPIEFAVSDLTSADEGGACSKVKHDSCRELFVSWISRILASFVISVEKGLFWIKI